MSPGNRKTQAPLRANAGFYQQLLFEQRLLPAVLTRMPLPDAVHHTFGQLKALVLNLYTDLPIFRQVWARRQAGVATAGIFIDAFTEVRRGVFFEGGGGRRAVLSRFKPLPTAGLVGLPDPAIPEERKLEESTGALREHERGDGLRWSMTLEGLERMPAHLCPGGLQAVKTMVVAYDLLTPADSERVLPVCEEVIRNADWIFLFARLCHSKRRPALPETHSRVEGKD